jgi:hypothetical protein
MACHASGQKMGSGCQTNAGGAVRPFEGRQEPRRHNERGATMPGFAYATEVNKGFANMRWLTNHLNEMAQQGWRLHTIFEQDKNRVDLVRAPRL